MLMCIMFDISFYESIENHWNDDIIFYGFVKYCIKRNKKTIEDNFIMRFTLKKDENHRVNRDNGFC